MKPYPLVALGVALVALGLGRAPARAAEQCPGDRVIWVSRQQIFDVSVRAAQVPGSFECLQRALQEGALPHPHMPSRPEASAPGSNPVSADAVPPPGPAAAIVGAAPVPAAHDAVRDSVYDDIDRGAHHERAGYGRYTYLLLTDPSDAERNGALLQAVMETTPIASSVSVDRMLLNVFEIPETTRFWSDSGARTDARRTLAGYDFGAAHDLVLKACAARQHPALCAGDLSGPFMLTYAHPLEALTIANPPYLIVDLHRLNASGFRHMVGLMKEQVQERDVADGHLVESTSVHLLSAVLDISDWLPNLIGDVKDITGVVGSH